VTSDENGSEIFVAICARGAAGAAIQGKDKGAP